jgi:hypothetical protein
MAYEAGTAFGETPRRLAAALLRPALAVGHFLNHLKGRS